MSFGEVTLELLKGFGLSCAIFAGTLVVAIPLGLLVSFGSMSKFKPLQLFTRGVVWVIRGTPLLLQLFIVFYIPSLFFDIALPTREMEQMIAIFVSFSINYACYFSEIYRGGIESISKGQYEACAVLGMKKSATFFHVILPQVIKRIVPPMSNEIITLVKDTSLARTIGAVEILFTAEKILSRRGLIWPLFYAGAFYLIFNGVLSVLFKYIEKKLDYYRI